MKIMILAGNDWSLVNFRGPLIRALVSRGHEVVACAPPESAEVPARLRSLGARYVPLSLRRTSVNPLLDFALLLRLRRLMIAERPDKLLSYTIKPVIYGSLAAAWAGVPQSFAMITGLGAAFAGDAPWWVRRSALALYRLAVRKCRRVFAQNADIAAFFLAQGIAEARQIVAVRGSGIDLGHYGLRPAGGGPPSFLLLARLLRDKGIYEYAEAARRMKVLCPGARFVLAGAVDSNPAAISLEVVRQWQDEGLLEYVPFQADVRPLLEACTVCVLPSYHEGIPRSLLEAMAVGRPIVTTNVPGCRETVKVTSAQATAGGVIVGENGLLVPMKSVPALVEAMQLLAGDPALAIGMGRRGREIAEAEFDADKVSAAILAGMEL